MIQKFIYPIVLTALLVLLFLGLADKLIYAKSGIERIIPFILIFGGIPFCTYKTLTQFLNKKNASKLTALSILM